MKQRNSSIHLLIDNALDLIKETKKEIVGVEEIIRSIEEETPWDLLFCKVTEAIEFQTDMPCVYLPDEGWGLKYIPETELEKYHLNHPSDL